VRAARAGPRDRLTVRLVKRYHGPVAHDFSNSRDVSGFDLRSLPADFYDDPFPYYAALRADTPIKRLPDGAFLLTRYADVEFVYKNPKIFSSDKKLEFGAKFGPTPLFEHHTTSLVFNDPPLHTRVRRLINGALTPRAIAQIQPDLESLIDRLTDKMAAKGSVDLIEEFAAAIPIEVIGNLLGVPHDERSPLRNWSLAILGALEPRLTPEATQRGNGCGAGVRSLSRRVDRASPQEHAGAESDLDIAAAARRVRRPDVEPCGTHSKLHLSVERRARNNHQLDR
jgi:cytochrome P450